MKKLFLAAAIALLLATGCETNFEKTTYRSLKIVETLYVSVYNVAKDCKERGLINQDQATMIANALDTVRGSFFVAKAHFTAYMAATGPKKEEAKERLVSYLLRLREDRDELEIAYRLIFSGIQGVQSWNELQPN